MRTVKQLIKYKRAIAISFVSGLLLSLVFFLFSMYEINKLERENQMMATEHFAAFDNQLNKLIYSNVNLLKGFIAYFQTNPDINDANAYAYLEHLLSDQSDLINNIGIIKDTTIIWNYPYEPNKSSIGVDLSKNENQREVVLNVKENLVTIFQGPVNLVQGGTGFVIRFPITESDGSYWGQISIVMKGDAFVEAIKTYEEALSIESIILSEQKIVYGDVALLDEDLYWFEFEDDLFIWEVGLRLTSHESNEYYKIIFLIIIGIVVFGIVSSATFLIIRASEVIKHEAVHDQLTGLRNRNTLDETIYQVFAAADRNHHKVGILLLDLNKFKEINDTFGHAAGDEVLRDTSKRMKHIARSDEMIFRVGGDEFLLVVPVVKDAQVLEVIKERLHGELTYRLDYNGHPIGITASIGAALYDDDGDNFDTLFQIADKRMYSEKNKVI